MVVVILSAVLLTAGTAAAVRWGGLVVQPPGPSVAAGMPVAALARRYGWWIALVFYTGATTGLLVVGPGGRLVMRILAVTSSPHAQGATTEAGEVVGEITVDGTIGFFLFSGLMLGLASALVYLLLHRWLPQRRLGALAFAIFLLAVFATRVEPLRRDNIDFHIVGPGWLSVTLFLSLTVVQAMAVAAFAARISRWLPEPSARPATILRYLPPLLLVATGIGAVALLLGFLATLAATRVPALVRAIQSRAALVAGRVALVVVTVALAPPAVAAIAAIATR